MTTAAVSAGVLAGLEPDPSIARLMGLLDPAFLAEAGWDEVLLVLLPPPGVAVIVVARRHDRSRGVVDEARVAAPV